ncbi:MAG: hypothetical protein GEEBNDBF_00255 [bacterium]|nr:hypothetical protein [bacterium]
MPFVLPSRFFCLIQDPVALGPTLRFIATLDASRKIPVALQPWSGREGEMVDETAMRRALDPVFLQVLQETRLPISWSLGDGDSWGEVASQLQSGDWLVVTYPLLEAAAWEEELAELLHWCPVPLLLMPDAPPQEAGAIVGLYDLTAAGERGLTQAAELTTTLQVPLQVLACVAEPQVDQVVALLETILAPFATDYQLSLLPDADTDDLLHYAAQLRPGLLVLGVAGAGIGIDTPFGGQPLDATLQALIRQAPCPVLCVPEWGEGLPEFPAARRIGSDIPPLIPPPTGGHA